MEELVKKLLPLFITEQYEVIIRMFDHCQEELLLLSEEEMEVLVEHILKGLRNAVDENKKPLLVQWFIEWQHKSFKFHPELVSTISSELEMVVV